MLRVLLVTISVGLADSINPSTIGPAIYLATGRRPVAAVTLFTIGVFAVDFAGGVLLTIGPGRLLLTLVPHPRGTPRHVLELVAGLALIAAAVGLWFGRHHLARRELPGRGGGGKSAFVTGATIAAIELATALPYFAVIAAIVALDTTIPREIVLIAVYSGAFVAPLLGVIVALMVAGERADPWLERSGAWLQRRWPLVLATLLLLAGGALSLAGASWLLTH
ncbi:MAG: GAP family protein [Thermoleophilaceae bacterium]